ncbi:MAG: hypothetical protein ACRC0L_00760, partial [Angustibacter sp.]
AAWAYRFARDEVGNTDVERIAALDLPRQPQGEAIAAEPGARTVLVGSEGARQSVWRIAVPIPKPPATLPLGLGSAPGGARLGQLMAFAGVPALLLVLWRVSLARRRRAIRRANRAARRGGQYSS